MRKDKTNTSMSKYRWAIVTSSGLIVGASVATGAYFVYDSLKDKGPAYIQYAEPQEVKLFGKVPLKIYETNPGQKNQPKTYFLSKMGMDLLKKKIEAKLNYGPELFNLTSISIDDKNSIGEDANGNYYPAYDTINLRSSGYQKEGLNVLKEGDIDSIDEEKVKVELLFQVLFHEYGHYKANKYLNVSTTKGKFGKWNTDFEENFEKDLNYTADKKGSPMAPFVNGRKWQSIGSLYTAYDLFHKVNYDHDYSFNELKNSSWKPVWSGFQPWFDTSKDFKGVDIDGLKYLYSMDELYTRKYEQIFYPIENGIIGNNKVGRENYISNSQSHTYNDADGKWQSLTLYSEDRMRYKDIVKDHKDYMADNPISKRKELTELMYRHEGKDEDISVMYLDGGKLRIGGYTNDDSYNIEINGNKIGTNIYSVPSLNTKINDKNFWVSDQINPDDIIGKTINRVFDDSGRKAPIINIRHDKDGQVTTHRDSIHHNDYHLSYDVDSDGNTTRVYVMKGAGV